HADRGDLLPRRPRPAGLRVHRQPRLPGGVRHPVHLFPVRTGGQAAERPDVHPDRSAHRLRKPGELRMALSPLNQRRFALFKAHKRGWWSLWLFLALFMLSLGAELIANDKPLVVRYDGQWFFPVFKRYPETTFGGEFPLQA